MKTTIAFAILGGMLFTDIFAQAPDYLWAKGAGGTNHDYGVSIATDANGNVYVTGYFGSSSIAFGSDTLTNAGRDDIFVVKYDANGNVLWAKSAGGASDDRGYSIATDANGNVYVTGGFLSSLISFEDTILLQAGPYDIFVVKYDTDGNLLWAKREGGTGYEWANDIFTDASGNVYVTGIFTRSFIVFGSDTLTSVGGSEDIFVMKYDMYGNGLWAKGAGGSRLDVGRDISTNTNGNVYVTGHFYSPSITFGSDTLTNAGGDDIFVVKLGSVTGIADLENNSTSVHIFPNPSKGNFFVALGAADGQSSEMITDIEILNVVGEKVYASKINAAQTEIDLSRQASGIYFITIKSTQGTAIKKLIINP